MRWGARASLVTCASLRDTRRMAIIPTARPDAAAGTATALDAVFGHRPELYRELRDFHALFWERPLVEPVLLELCRLRVAALLGCKSELAIRYEVAHGAGLDEAKIAALEHWHEDDRFSACERAVLCLAELFVRDPHAITDDDVAAVVSELGDAGTIALVEALALFDGFARFRILLGVAPERAAPQRVPAPATGADSMY